MENLRPTQLYFRNCFTFLFSLGLFLTPSVLESQITGSVFRDFNGNGTKDANEPLVQGITINAYNASNTLCGTATSAGTTAPNYSLTGCGTASVRVEFVVPSTGSCANSAIDFSALGGTTYGSSVQFVNGNSTDVNFAVHNPSDYNTGTTGVNIFIPCYISGDPLPANSPSGALDWFVGYPYINSGTTTTLPPTQKLNGAIIGSTWGVAYSKQAQKVFTSAFIKRHVGLGTMGTGGIYLLTPTANSFTVNSFYDLDVNNYRTRADATAPAYGEGTSYSIAADNSTITYLGATDALTGKPSGLGVIGTNTDRGLSTAIEIPSYDPAAFDQTGKVGLGDIDISDDGKYLFVMNLYSRKVFRLELNDAYNPTSVVNVTSYDVPATTCTNGEYRPWGLKFFRNKLYVGVVCSGENGGTAANLNASVYELNNPTASATFNASALITVPLNYNKYGDYNPWTKNSGSVTGTTYPQPKLSDIEFTDNGDMVLGIMDRAGNQWGESNRKFLKTSTTSITLSTSGDILIAGLNCSTGGFTLENNGTYTSANGSTLSGTNTDNSEGPGGKEFFMDNSNVGDPHRETVLGALAILKGQGEMLLPAYGQSTNSGDAGTLKLSTTNGVYRDYYELYNRNFNGILAKANGLGDVELSGAETPLEIGNRVWSDTDSDGIQDAGEAGIDGVTVKLFEGSTEVGSMTTANGGQYYFTNANVTGGVKTNTAYEIRIATAQTPLSTLSLTTTDVGTNGSDLIDNDGTVSGANAIKTFTTGTAGQNNHSYDFGFSAAPLCTLPTLTNIVADTATCTSGQANSDAKITVSGIANGEKYSYGTNGTSDLYYASATSFTGTTFTKTALPAPSVPTTYTFRIYGADSTCYNDTTVILNPSTCASCGDTFRICAGETLNVTAQIGLTNIQWRKDGNVLVGETNPSLTISSVGIYTVTGNDLNGCAGNLCCPIVVLDSTCCIVPTITSVAADTATCTNGVANSDAMVAVRGIVGMTKYVYGTNGTSNLYYANAIASTADTIKLAGLANPSVATTYTFRIYATDSTCYNDTTIILNPSVCPQCAITGTFTQNACNDNGTAVVSTDDYFTVTVSAVSATNGGASGKYEVVLNGTTVINTGGTAYGTSVTVGGIGVFAADGTTTYTLTVRDLDNPSCSSTTLTTTAVQNCSSCPPPVCIPLVIELRKKN